MMRRTNVLILCILNLWIGLWLAGCQEESETPVHPVEGRAALNYYDVRGLGEGLINAALEEEVGIVALPDGTWRIRYRVDGRWWQIVVRSQGQTCHYLGTYQKIDALTVQQGAHPSDLNNGLLEGVSVTESQWQALPHSEELWVVKDGVLASWITPLDRQEFCPQGAPVVAVATVSPTATPAPTPLCEGVTFEGFCWYLSETEACCQETCEAEGLSVDTAVDTDGNFWDAHDAASCRSLLLELQHPHVETTSRALSTPGDYGLCGATASGIVLTRNGGPHATTQIFMNGQVACPCQ